MPPATGGRRRGPVAVIDTTTTRDRRNRRHPGDVSRMLQRPQLAAGQGAHHAGPPRHDRHPLPAAAVEHTEDPHAGSRDLDAGPGRPAAGRRHARPGAADLPHRPLDLLQCFGAPHGGERTPALADPEPRYLTSFPISPATFHRHTRGRSWDDSSTAWRWSPAVATGIGAGHRPPVRRRGRPRRDRGDRRGARPRRRRRARVDHRRRDAVHPHRRRAARTTTSR